MEEEEAQENKEIIGKDRENDEESRKLSEKMGTSHTEHVDISGSNSSNVGDTHLQGFENVNMAVEDSLFEKEYLKDVDSTVGTSLGVVSRLDHSSIPDNMRHSFSGIDEVLEYSLENAAMGSDCLADVDVHHDPTMIPDPHRQPASSTNLDPALYIYGDSGCSPVNSPIKPKPKPKPVMPNVSPELLHLVDSAIMGKPDSMDTLKNIVSGAECFGNGEEELESIALLVVDSLLATMGGVESFGEDEDSNPPCVMLNSRAAIVAGELIPWLPFLGDFEGYMSARTRMVRGLLVILRSCTRNRAMCSTAGLLGVLLRSAEKIFVPDVGVAEQPKWDGLPLCSCIQYLAGHSLSVIDLHRWFDVVNRTLTTVWAAHLMLSLEKAMNGNESTGPSCTFEFDGESSGLFGPGDSRWPFVNGYAFATWIYIESFADSLNAATAAAAIAAAAAAKSGNSSAISTAAVASALAGEGTANMPRLFSFLSADNQVIEAYFHAQFLVVESGSGKAKNSLHFTHAFKPQCWYFVGVEHTSKQALLGKTESELRLYIDGSMYESHPSDFPKISKPLAFCCIGTSSPPTVAGSQNRRRQCPLFAEMGPIYIFKEPIGPEKMARLAARGGDTLPSFGSGAGLPWLATNSYVQTKAEESALLDAEIGGCLHLLYHPSLLSGRFCSDASPSGSAGMLRRPAEVLGQVRVATRMKPAEAFWALAHGGPMSLLPLAISDVHRSNLESEQGKLPVSVATTALAAPIFRIIGMAIQHPGNNEELCRTRGPEVLSRILDHLLQTLSSLDVTKHGLTDEELVAAIANLCQSQKYNHALKVHLFSTLLLDLKIWSFCSCGLQKKLLSSLADMVFTEASVLRDANAIQILLDGCRKCYWTIREKDSINTFSLDEGMHPVGQVNALVDELLIVIELLVVAAPSLAVDDIRCLLRFMVDCPQMNQVARILHLIHRLVVQPNTSRAQTFAKAFISSGGIESLLVLLQREAKAGDAVNSDPLLENDTDSSVSGSERKTGSHADNVGSGFSDDVGAEDNAFASHEGSGTKSLNIDSNRIRSGFNIESMASASEDSFLKNLDGIRFSISGENGRNNVLNVDNSDGILVAIIGLLGALVISGHLKFGPQASPDVTGNILASDEEGGTMFDDKVSLLHFALQKVFQAAPNRLMTSNVCIALLAASINVSSTEDEMNFYDSRHRFEHIQILLVLLRSLPYASKGLQSRALQDLLFLACSHHENRKSLTQMEEWPEWILEVLISNYETGTSKGSNSQSLRDVEDLIHNFLIIMLEHSMRQKDGWKDIEATIHCAEWLCMIGGSSTGDQRIRREESLPIIKRRLLGELLDFSAQELQVQTQVIAAAAAGVAAEGLLPMDSKAEAENAAQLSVALVENAIVVLMLVEDHLRLQSKLYSTSRLPDPSASPLSRVLPVGNTINRSSFSTEPLEAVAERRSSSSDSRGLPLDVLASMADSRGKISAAAMERLTAAAAAEPYQSVSYAFVSYGSCAVDLAKGWKFRSRLWYGVGLPSTTELHGGGSGWESWRSALEKDEKGDWVELPLMKKSIAMLQALLLDETGLGGGLGVSGGSGTGMGGMAALYQLLDSDQPFLCMLRMVLVSMREADDGETSITRNENNEETSITRNENNEENSFAGIYRRIGSTSNSDKVAQLSIRTPQSALLWSVLSPVLNMPISESKRQRVLVACCVLYSEVWHAVDRDRNPLRKQYLEGILPPFVATLRRWRPLLSGIHELAPSDGLNPFVADDRALAADAFPIESALAMVSPGWAAAFASPPAAMALAMIAAGAGGGETAAPVTTVHLRRDSSLLERKQQTRLQTFSSFQKPPEDPSKASVVPKDKAAAKAAALAAARDLERNAKIGSGRGLSAVAMATSAQRRNNSDTERVKRWTVSEAMGTAWMECLESVDSKSVYGKDFNALSYKFIAVLVGSLALARNMQRSAADKRAQLDVIARHRVFTGICAWRKLIHYLTEIKCLFGPFTDHWRNPKHVFWKLDIMESSLRMRQCLRRNYNGSDHSGAAVNYEENVESKHDQNNATDPFKSSFLVAEALTMEAIDEEDEQGDTCNLEGTEESVNPEEEIRVGSSETVKQPLQVTVMSADPHATREQEFDTPSVVAPGYVSDEQDERILFEVSASMVHPLRILRGTFQITSKRINFIVDKAEINPMRSGLDCSSENISREKDQCWLLSSLHRIYQRRYLLRRSALELFMVDRSNYLFDLRSTEGRRDAYRAIVQTCPPNLSKIYLATQKPDQLLKRTQLMERWARWEISNFEYIMQLNTLAGRSYNDITQYPVFPWILSDYSSKTLDLSTPSSYRDLSKPVGALNPDRLKKFQERYSNCNDPVVPKFHYDSHYSSAATVLYYLIRVEPFTTLSVKLHGGKFDHADRMFSDIPATWNGVLDDMGNVKELVPEFFCLPEILINENSIDFGTTQLGERLDSVRLPAWAQNAVDFIHKHRTALEGEHVSAHLHEWIDLIFGHKQRGKEAISANNVFHYITYEGNVNIDKISDPAQKHAIQDQVAYFGQTPSQLLTVPHLKKMPLTDVLHLQTIFRNPTEVKPYVVPSPERCNLPAASIYASSDSVIVADISAPAAHIAQHKWQPNTLDGQETPFQFQHGKADENSSGTFARMLKGSSGTGSEQWHFPQASAFAASGIRSSAIVSITCDNEIITGGHVDNSVRLISSDGAKTMEIARGHNAPVTCLSLSHDSSYLVTGSRDATVLLWRLHRAPIPCSSRMPEVSAGSSGVSSPANSNSIVSILADKSRRHRFEGPIHVLRGHLHEITCCSVSSDLGIVASCSNASDILLHSIRRGRLIRRLVGVSANVLSLSSYGIVVTWNESLHTLSAFTLNGTLVASAKLPFSSNISCMEVSLDGRSALIGLNSCSDNDGVCDDSSRLDISLPSVCFFDLHSLKVLHSMQLREGQDITALSLNKDNTHILVSTADRQLIIFTDPALRLKADLVGKETSSAS